MSQVLLVCAATLVLFVGVHLYEDCCYALSLTEAILAVAVVLLYWLLQRDISMRIIEDGLMICAVLLFAALIFFESIENSGAYWMAGFPFVAYFVKDARAARYWVGFFVIGMVAASALESIAIVTAQYSPIQLMCVVAVCLFFWLLAHIYKTELDGHQTLLEKTNRALDAQQLHMKVILDHAPVGIWMLDTNRHIQFLNNAWVQWIGVSEEEARKQEDYSTLLPDDVARQCLASDEACLNSDDNTYSVREVIPCADGKAHTFDMIKVKLSNAKGEPTGLVGFAIDVTERLEAEETQQKLQLQMQHAQRLESVGVLAGGIAHDFNNLLTAIQGHNELARLEEGLPPGIAEHLDCIEQASHTAADLCQQMLAYSGKGKFVVQDISLTELVRGVQQLIESSVGKHVKVHYRLDDKLPAIEADISQIRQVLLNLVINASESIPEDQAGEITITTGTMEPDESYFTETYIGREIIEDSYAYLEVSDNGCGMDAETQGKIFEPFFTTKFAGRGLGLSAVYGIVKGHKGSLKIDSHPGQGTSMRSSFPYSDRKPSAIGLSGSQQVELEMPPGKVLLVDDEATVLRVASRMLERMGLDVITAKDGLEGVEAFRKHQGDIICVLLDMTMPNMDGMVCMAELRRFDPAVKVLLSSGYNEDELIERLEGVMPDAFLKKPYTYEALQQKLGEAIA